VLMQARFGADFPLVDFIKAVGQLNRERHADGVALNAGVVELLDHLDALAIPYAIATSSAPAMVERNLGHHGLTARFKTTVARGDYERGKPSPDPFLKAAERLGVAPEHCLALEDSHNGVRAAHAAGMMTVMVPDMLAATAEMQALCVAIEEDLHAVRARLI
jgi:HAD superfamily hydrolase (TIGR01509 family)